MDTARFMQNMADIRLRLEAAAAQGGHPVPTLVAVTTKVSDAAFLAAAARLSPRRIVYISCCPETQARDLALLQKSGYRVTLIQPVDMFPHTPHVENVVLLEVRE